MFILIRSSSPQPGPREEEPQRRKQSGTWLRLRKHGGPRGARAQGPLRLLLLLHSPAICSEGNRNGQYKPEQLRSRSVISKMQMSSLPAEARAEHEHSRTAFKERGGRVGSERHAPRTDQRVPCWRGAGRDSRSGPLTNPGALSIHPQTPGALCSRGSSRRSPTIPSPPSTAGSLPLPPAPALP